MSKKKHTPSVKKNFAYSMAFQILSVVLPFLTAPYLSRVLGAGPLGVQSYTASVQTYFRLVATLGTASYGAREIARARDDRALYSKLFWEIELLSILTSMVSVLAWSIVIVRGSTYSNFYLVMTLNLFATMFNIEWLFRGLEQFKTIVLRNTFFKVAGVVLTFLLIKSPEDLWLYIALTAVTNLCSSLTLWTYLPKVLDRVQVRDLHIVRHFRETLIYFVPTIATSIYTSLDKTLIGLITKADVENGYYDQAEKIINMAKSLSFSALDSVLGVRISYLFAQNKEAEIHSRIENSFNYIFFMAFGCMCGIMGVAKNFVPFFFGTGYDAVVPLLYIFAPIIAIIGVSSCMGGHYYGPSGRRSTSAKFLIVGACINLALNLMMIPRWGSTGAAIASVIAETVISTLYVRFSNGFCTVRLLLKTGGKKLAAGLLMFVVVKFLGDWLPTSTLLTLIIQVTVGVALYGALLLLLRDQWVLNYRKNLLGKVRGRGKRAN